MLIIGELRQQQNRKLVQFERGDKLIIEYQECLLKTKHGMMSSTDKCGGDQIRYAKVTIVGFLDDDILCNAEPQWVAAIDKMQRNGTDGEVKPFASKHEAEAYLNNISEQNETWENMRNPDNWTIYPEDQWEEI